MELTDPEYPYWKNDFDKEFNKGKERRKEREIRFREKDWPKDTDDAADEYRVFMILCNNRDKKESRMDILNKMMKATKENPIMINDEIFWFEEY